MKFMLSALLMIILYQSVYINSYELPVCANSCSSNCLACANNGTCTSCQIGYTLNPANSSLCIKNICNAINCSVCDANGLCIKCVSEY